MNITINFWLFYSVISLSAILGYVLGAIFSVGGGDYENEDHGKKE